MISRELKVFLTQSSQIRSLLKKNYKIPEETKLSSNDRKLARLYDTHFIKITTSHTQSITKYLVVVR